MKDNNRINFIDFIKGLAVIFMMFQHFGIWFWDIPWEGITNILSDFPVYMAVNATGGFSAPAFITCAGFGAYYFNEKYKSGTKFIKRGFVLIFFGYLMNLIVRSWFTWASWYILHLLGFCLVIAPFILKIRRRTFLFLLMLSVIAAAVVLQFKLNTPYQYSSERMGNFRMSGGVFRLMFVEGHFPVFPWTAFFISGIISADFFKNHARIRILWTSVACLVISVIILSAGIILGSLRNGVARFLTAGTSFYPLYPVMLFFLLGLVLVSIYFLSFINFSSKNIIVQTGRLSLTIFILHVLIFKQGMKIIGVYQMFTAPVSFCLMIIFSLLFIMIAKIWNRKKLVFSFEWFLRKLA